MSKRQLCVCGHPHSRRRGCWCGCTVYEPDDPDRQPDDLERYNPAILYGPHRGDAFVWRKT